MIKRKLDIVSNDLTLLSRKQWMRDYRDIEDDLEKLFRATQDLHVKTRDIVVKRSPKWRV